MKRTTKTKTTKATPKQKPLKGPQRVSRQSAGMRASQNRSGKAKG